MNLVKILFFSGLALIALAGVVLLFKKMGIPIGRLPGDIYVKGKNSSFYFPIVSCLMASLVLSLLFHFFRK